MSSAALKIDMIGGNCPVQAEGTINGQPFYFRARGQHWSFGVGADPVRDPAWYLCVQWGDSEFAAGWMEETEARRLIDQCVTMFAAPDLLAATKAAQEFMGGFLGDEEMEAKEITPVRKQLADAIAKAEGR